MFSTSYLKFYTMSEGREVYLSNIAICVFNGFSCYIAIVLNIFTIHAIRKTSSLPKTLKTLLLSLAVSDLGVGLLVQPLHITVIVMEMKQGAVKNSTYDTTNIVFLISAYLFSYASFFGVIALSVDRFLAIHLHLRYQELVTHKRVVAVVISMWVLSELLSLLTLWIPQNARYVIFTTIVVICLITTTLFYCKIYSTVRYHKNQFQVLQVQQIARNGEIANEERMRKSAVGTFYVYLVFLICYLPDISIHVVIFESSGQSILIKQLHGYLATLVFLNSSLNPLIYCWKMKHSTHHHGHTAKYFSKT